MINANRGKRKKKNRKGKPRNLFKKIQDTKGTLHSKMGTIKDKSKGPKRSRRDEKGVAIIDRRSVQKRS